MSDTYKNTSGGADSYNAGAAHDSGFYDPDKHDNQIVAVFEDQKAANIARDALIDAAVPGDQVQVVANISGDAASGASRAEDGAVGDQILTAFMSLFTSHDDHNDFTHAVNQGHAMVVVTPAGDTDRHRVIQVLEHSHPIDFDAKLAEWRQAGYDNSGAARSLQHEDRRVGQRETMRPQTSSSEPQSSSRVRSYVADRDTTGGTTTDAVGMGQGDATTAPRG